MEKFTLISTIIIEENLQANVCLKPSNLLIEDYIATYRSYPTEQDALDNLSDFILEMTPILFDDFQQMDNIPQQLREQFTLS